MAASAAAMVLSVLFVAGTATQFQDHGHVNYLVAIVVGQPQVGIQWLSDVGRGDPRLVAGGGGCCFLTLPADRGDGAACGGVDRVGWRANHRWFRVVATAGSPHRIRDAASPLGIPHLASLVDAVGISLS